MKEAAGDLERILNDDAVRAVCIVGESGVGKTSLANDLVARLAGTYDLVVTTYLPPQGLLHSAEDLLVSALSDKLLSVSARGLTPAALLAEIFESVRARRVLCLIDNAESLAPGWLTAFVQRWLECDGRSLLMITAPAFREPPRRESAAALGIYELRGLPPGDEQLILGLLGEQLCATFPREELLAVAGRLRNIPQRLLYLKWLAPATLQRLREIAGELAHNLELTDLVRQIRMRSNGPIVPFLALGRVRAVRFEEGLLAALWSRLGGESVEAYIRSRDSLVALGVLSRAVDAPGSFHLNPAVHVQLEKYVSRELAPEQLAQIEYHIGEYYKGRFLESRPTTDAEAVNEFIYHSARARNVDAAARFLIAGGWLERLRREGQALAVRRILATTGQELDDAPDDAGGRSLTSALSLEQAHVSCDLSDYEQALAALNRAELGVDAFAEGGAATHFQELISYRRGICLGDSGRLRESAASYLGVVQESLATGRLSPIAVESLGYAAMVLGYLREPVARRLGDLGVQFAERLGDPILLARNCCSQAQLLSHVGSMGEAAGLIGRAAGIVDSAGGSGQDRRELGRVWIARAFNELALGDLAGARCAVSSAAALNRQVGDRRRLARGELLGGAITFREQSTAGAIEVMTGALEGLVRVGDMLNGLLCCFNLAYLVAALAPAAAIRHASNSAAGGRWAEVLRRCIDLGFDVRAIGAFWTSCYAPRILAVEAPS
jgi:hypothetical protein